MINKIIGLVLMMPAACFLWTVFEFGKLIGAGDKNATDRRYFWRIYLFNSLYAYIALGFLVGLYFLFK